MKFSLILVSALLICTQKTSGVNILYLSNIPSPSHFIWCKSLLKSLHERGHNITALSPDVEKSTDRFTYIHLERIYPDVYNGSEKMDFLEMGKLSYIDMFKEFAGFINTACESTLKSKGYDQLLAYPEDFKFDLAIVDFTMSHCVTGMLHRFNYPPVVGVSPFLFSTQAAMLSGSLLFPAFIPTPDSIAGPEMNFMERMSTSFESVFEILFDQFFFLPKANREVPKKHPEIQTVTNIEKKHVKMILINSQPLTDYRQPTFPHVKYVGGAQIQKPKDLPGELQKVAEKAKSGLVLFSLGTNVRSDTLGDERIKKILKALGRLSKYTFMWKFETKEKLPVNLPANVMIQAWMPQNDILAHPNTKLFISHCGLLSTQEALWYGVPVLGFPVFADQPQNAMRLETMGVGQAISIHDFSEDELHDTIKELLENPQYRAKAKKISSALRDQPMTPLEEATYWTEWVLRHPDIDLTSPSKNMSLFVRHSLDVFLLFVLTILVAVYLWIKIIALTLRLCSPFKSQSDKKQKIN